MALQPSRQGPPVILGLPGRQPGHRLRRAAQGHRRASSTDSASRATTGVDRHRRRTDRDSGTGWPCTVSVAGPARGSAAGAGRVEGQRKAGARGPARGSTGQGKAASGPARHPDQAARAPASPGRGPKGNALGVAEQASRLFQQALACRYCLAAAGQLERPAAARAVPICDRREGSARDQERLAAARAAGLEQQQLSVCAVVVVEHLVARQLRHSDTLAEREQGRPRWPSRQEIVPGESA